MSMNSLQLLYQFFVRLNSPAHAEEVATYVQGSPLVLVPWEHIWTISVPNIIWTMLVLTAVYGVADFVLVDYAVPSEVASVPLKRAKVCHQITNLFANLVLTVAGIHAVTNIPPAQSAADYFHGLEEFDTVITLQMGYALWSAPVGIWWVREELPLIVHHVAVAICCCLSAFCVNGFRYWGSFFFGVVEISSIPLAIMNVFKDNRALTEQYPSEYLATRVTFCLVFLYVRIWMFLPRICLFTYDLLLVAQATQAWSPKVFFYVVALASTFLTFLQLHWARLIVKGLIKTFLPGVAKKLRLK